MKRSTVRTALMASALLSGTMALADPSAGPPPGGPRGPSIERLAQDLNLDATQQAEVKRILDAQRARMDAERQQFEASGQRPSREDLRARHEQANAELRQQLSGVLTAEQLARFDELRQKQRPPGPRPE